MKYRAYFHNAKLEGEVLEFESDTDAILNAIFYQGMTGETIQSFVRIEADGTEKVIWPTEVSIV